MCLGIPMEVVAVDRFVARCEARGVTREVNLLMLGEDAVAPGDYVVVHLGYAISTVSAEEAATAWALYDQMLAG
jgi:hydrogenase expression/formation protein HypC